MNESHDTQPELADLSRQFWAWRARQQPRGSDDIPRLERPADWTPDWTPGAVERYRRDLAEFEERCRALNTSEAPVPVRVDHRLIGSALARVRWELDVLASWRRDPGFYIDQSIGVAFDQLLMPPPIGPARRAALLRMLAAVPGMLSAGVANLTGHAVGVLAERAAVRLADVAEQVRETGAALGTLLPADAADIRQLADAAATALAGFRDQLAELPGPRSATADPAVGRAAFQFFLSRVALLPYTPDELMTIGRQEYERAQALETIAATRTAPVRPAAIDGTAQRAQQQADEDQVRAWYRDQGLLTLPPWLRRYRMAAIPDYLVPLSWLGVTDDLTSPGRLGEDAVSYSPEPGGELPFFYAANAVDNRLGILHEGCHYYQLAQSWAHPDPIRRHYYDSAPCEGIAFYNEELALEAGVLADNAPACRLVRTFMRLRALRLLIDTGLAIGSLTYQQAERQLAELVPLDAATARQEAGLFVATSGQGGSYQIGKTQILGLLAAARAADTRTADTSAADASGWDLARFHDYLWQNGNVPLSLLRWELLGLRDDVDRADALAPAESEVFGVLAVS